MAEDLTPSTVLSWLKIEEGSANDYFRDLRKQPLRRAVIWERLYRENSKLTRLRNELSLIKQLELPKKKQELKVLIAKKVVEYKKLENPKSQAAVDNYTKYDLELDPQVKALREEIAKLEERVVELSAKIAEQENVVNTWQAAISMLKEKSGTLKLGIWMEVGPVTSKESLVDEID